MSSAELDFYRTERPRLVAIGMTDYHEQAKELERRWQWLQNAAFAPKVEPSSAEDKINTLTLETRLSSQEAKEMNLVLIDIDPSGYTYGHVTDAADDNDPMTATRQVMGDMLSRAKKTTLQLLCEDLGLPNSGNKGDLVDRILSDF